MGLLSRFRDRISWKWEFGIKRGSPADYRLEYETKPISDDVFRKISEKYIKQAFGKGIGEIEFNDRLEIPLEIIKHNEQVLLLGLPKVRPSNAKLLTKHIVDMSYEHIKEGWVIRVGVEGIRRLF